MAELFLFPYNEVPKGSRIVIYGAGMVAEDYVAQLRKNQYCDVVLMVAEDYKNNARAKRIGWELFPPEALKERFDYSYVVLSVYVQKFREEIMNKLSILGVPEEKIISTIMPIQSREKTYSQHGEDLIIYNAFKHMGFFRDGRLPSYIDIGAHHPYDISNTALFYQLGCRGVNIEANPELIKAFEKERPDDINLCFGIGKEEGEFPFYITDVPGLNSFRKENIEYNEFLVEQDTGVKEKYPIKKVMQIPIYRLPDVIERYCHGKWPDFLSIDIEGMEYESLSICDFKNGPALMAVEVNYSGDRFIEMLENKGYFPYLWYRENILFVKKEYESLVYAHDER